MKKFWLTLFSKNKNIYKEIRKENYYVSLINNNVKKYFSIDNEFYVKYRISLIETKLISIKKDNNKNNYYFEIFIFTSSPAILIGKAGKNINNITKIINDDILSLKTEIKNNFIDKNDDFIVKITLKEILPVNFDYETKIIKEYEEDYENLSKL